MGSTLHRLAVALTVCLILPVAALAAAEGSERYELRGQILTPDNKPMRGRRVLNVNLHGNTATFTKSTLSFGGKFKFRGLLPGSYTVVIAPPGLGETRQTVEVGETLADAKRRIEVQVVLREQDRRAGRVISVEQLSIPEKAWAEYRRAMKKFGERETEAGIAHLEKAIGMAPQFVQALNHLGTVYYHKNQFTKAEEYFRKALEQDGNAYEPLVNLGGTLLNQNRYEEALAFNRNAVLARPNDALAHSQLGMNLFSLGDLEQAAVHLRRAKKLDPAHFSHPQFLLAEIYLRKGERRAALSELEELTRLHPDDPRMDRVRAGIARLRRQVQ